MKKIDEIRELLQKKAYDLKTEDDKEKYEGVSELLAFDNVFSKMGVEVAIGLLDFLGIEEDKILKTYVELVAEETAEEARNTYINIGRKQ
jgi:hypothetical protein